MHFSKRLYDVDGMDGGLEVVRRLFGLVWWGDVGYSWRAGVGVLYAGRLTTYQTC